MSDDTDLEILTEQGLIDKANTLLETINIASAKFTDTLLALAAHKTDTEAHQDIRDEIQSVINATGFATTEQAAALAADLIAGHNTSEMAHDDIRDLITAANTAISTLKSRVDAIDASSADDQTQVEILIAGIEARYASVLNNLLQAYLVADMNNTGNKEEIVAAYNQALAQKAAEIQAVYTEYNYA